MLQRHDEPLPGTPTYEKDIYVSLSARFKCTCLQTTHAAVDARQTPATQPNAPLKPKQSNLVAWMRMVAGNPVPDGDAIATVECTGRVTVRIEEDRSHPVEGIKGQKVTVKIAH